MTFEREGEAERESEPGLVAILTLVIWVGCVVVGVLGLLFARWHGVGPATQSVRAQFMQVDVVRESAPAEAAPPDEFRQPPAEGAVRPVMAVMPAVALSSPMIAFAVPVEGPGVLVTPARAAPVAAGAAARSVVAGMERLRFGVGVGRQPAPEYPREAAMDGEEGVVVVAFTVGEDGHVLAARASVPCRWGLLNQAAVRTVREQWRFPAGAVRAFEISIEFQLTR